MKKKIFILMTAVLIIMLSSILLSQGVYTTMVEYAGGDPIYIGKANPGSATSAAEWQIVKLTWAGEDCTAIQYAGGSSGFINVWDDRATYNYN